MRLRLHHQHAALWRPSPHPDAIPLFSPSSASALGNFKNPDARHWRNEVSGEMWTAAPWRLRRPQVSMPSSGTGRGGQDEGWRKAKAGRDRATVFQGQGTTPHSSPLRSTLRDGVSLRWQGHRSCLSPQRSLRCHLRSTRLTCGVEAHKLLQAPSYELAPVRALRQQLRQGSGGARLFKCTELRAQLTLWCFGCPGEATCTQ
jgi:hypothetical protein